MHNHHQHNHCSHTKSMDFCSHCNQAYCTKCGKNWYANSTWAYGSTAGTGNIRLLNTQGLSGTVTTGYAQTDITNAKHDH